jgi:hypothetical protein
MQPNFLKNAKYPVQVKYDVAWPYTIFHNDVEYYREYERTGKRSSDGCPSQRYSCLKGWNFIWLDLDGTIKDA